MAMISTPVVIPSLVIAGVTFFLSILGLTAGGKLGDLLGKRVEILGGVILVGIGIQIFLSHMG